MDKYRNITSDDAKRSEQEPQKLPGSGLSKKQKKELIKNRRLKFNELQNEKMKFDESILKNEYYEVEKEKNL